MRRAVIAVVVSLCALLPNFVGAQTESSAHYQVQQVTLTGGGLTNGSSASYSQSGSLGEPAVGLTSGATTNSNGGFDRSSSGSSGGAGSTGGSGGSGGVASVSAGGSGGGVVFGCTDPVATNYSPLAFGYDDASCIYSPATLVSSDTASTLVTQTAAAAMAASSSSYQSIQSTVPSLSVSLDSSSVSVGTPLAVTISQTSDSLHPLTEVSLSLVRQDGTLATSTTLLVENGQSSLSQSFATGDLSPGNYTLHVHAHFDDGSQTDRNEPFTIDAKSAVPMSPWGWALIAAALCGGVVYIRKRS